MNRAFRLCLVLVCFVLMGQAIDAQQPARDRHRLRAPLSVVIDDAILEAIDRRAAFTEDQVIAARGLHAAYWDAVLERAAALSEVTSAGQRDRLPTDPEGRAAYEAQRRKVIEKMIEANKAQRDASYALLTDFAALVTDHGEQRAVLAADFRFELLRHTILQPDPRAVFADFGGRVDVIELIEQAGEEENELAPLFAEQEDEPRSPELEQARHQIEQVLARYRAQMLPRLEARLEERLTPPRPRQPTTMLAGTPEFEAYMKERTKEWNENHGVLDDYRNELRAIILGSLGAEAADAFENRLMRAWCPNLYHPNWPDVAIEQLRKDDSLDAETLSRLNIVYDEFVRERAARRREAVQIGLRACRKHGVVFGMEEDQQTYAAKIMTFRSLIMTTHERLLALLPPEKRTEFEVALDRAVEEDSRMLSPMR